MVALTGRLLVLRVCVQRAKNAHRGAPVTRRSLRTSVACCECFGRKGAVLPLSKEKRLLMDCVISVNPFRQGFLLHRMRLSSTENTRILHKTIWVIVALF